MCAFALAKLESASARPRDSSFQNVFPAVIREIKPPQAGQVDIRLDAGCPLWARITTRALETMALQPGQVVHALVKSVALTRADMARYDAPSQARDGTGV